MVSVNIHKKSPSKNTFKNKKAIED